MLLPYKAEDYPDNLEGKSVYPTIFTPCFSTILPFSTNLQFPPASAAKSTITLPAFISLTCSSKISSGASLPGIKAVVIIISTSLHYYLNKAISAAINSGDISLAYPPYPSPSSVILTVKNEAPKDSTYSLTAGLVSKALTIAPKDLAVAIADKPATPPPITKTLAGGNLPAAVI